MSVVMRSMFSRIVTGSISGGMTLRCARIISTIVFSMSLAMGKDRSAARGGGATVATYTAAAPLYEAEAGAI
jgi:hypothetical protein